MKKYYAGIGSRNTPPDILKIMTSLARSLEKDGFILRSGGADGADDAFEKGVDNPDNKQIFLPWNNFNGRVKTYPTLPEAYVIAKEHHTYWHSLSNGAQALHARNCHQVLGPDLKTPSKFVICWTADGCSSRETRTGKTGGTGQAISVASANHIAIFNIKNPDHLHGIQNYIKLGK